MMFKTTLIALGLAALTEASAIKRTPTQDNSGPLAKRASSTCLDANALQTGSASTGQSAAGAADGQVESATDNANFINFCSGLILTNGLQVKTGSCNGIPMGNIPSTTNMVTTVILNPKLNDDLVADTTFNITLAMNNLDLGHFTNATSTYYSAPQDVNRNGEIIGHTHVTVQDVGNSFQFSTPLDATTFAFFKGINEPAVNGQVSAVVTGGLPAGNYRVCTMAAASNHQPVLMPVAQRGAQDDCRYFSVSASTSTSKNSNTNTNNAASSTTTSSSSSSGSSSSSSSAIAGIEAPAVTSSGNSARPFEVNGNTFVNKSAAVQRACAIQNNQCADAVNSGKASGFTVSDCNAQETTCNASA